MPIGDKTQLRQAPPQRHKNSNATHGKKSRLNSYSTMSLIFCFWYSIKCVWGNIGVVMGTSKERETWVTQVMGEHWGNSGNFKRKGDSDDTSNGGTLGLIMGT